MDEIAEIQPQGDLNDAIGKIPIKTLKGKTDYLLIFSNQKEVKELDPDFTQLAKVGGRGVIASAVGDEVDFVSRF